jgi:hypothetical protein
MENDQSIGLLRRKDNHIRRMRIREESITLNISSRAISDCCCSSNLPDRNGERERAGKKTKELCYRYIEQKQIVLMGIDKKKRRKKTNESENIEKSQILDR